jgi:hypothetical protein
MLYPLSYEGRLHQYRGTAADPAAGRLTHNGTCALTVQPRRRPERDVLRRDLNEPEQHGLAAVTSISIAMSDPSVIAIGIRSLNFVLRAPLFGCE